MSETEVVRDIRIGLVEAWHRNRIVIAVGGGLCRSGRHRGAVESACKTFGGRKLPSRMAQELMGELVKDDEICESVVEVHGDAGCPARRLAGLIQPDRAARLDNLVKQAGSASAPGAEMPTRLGQCPKQSSSPFDSRFKTLDILHWDIIRVSRSEGVHNGQASPQPDGGSIGSGSNTFSTATGHGVSAHGVRRYEFVKSLP